MKPKTKHTAGEWVNTSDGESNFYGIAANKDWLLRIQQNGKLLTGEQEANAKLIAASPDLLEALKKFVSAAEYFGLHDKGLATCYLDAKEAIKKNNHIN